MGRPRSPAVDHAERLVREEGLSMYEAAQRADCSYSAVFKRLHRDKALAWSRLDNARPERQAAKRAWNATPIPCPRCGGGMGRYAKAHCIACENQLRQRAKEARDEDIIALWAEGATLQAVADEVGMTTNALGVAMYRIRKERGPEALPYRNRLSNPAFT